MISIRKRIGRLPLLQRGLRCAFCGGNADDVERLLAGESAYICNSGVNACVAILREHGGSEPYAPGRAH